MGAQLNIKDRQIADLAQKLARQSGRTLTATIRDALEREDRAATAAIQERVRLLNAIVDEVQRTLPDDVRGLTSKELMDCIYDDTQDDGFAL